MTRLVLLLLALTAVVAAVGCGSEGVAREEAVEAREQNVVEKDGVRYRVVIFRELNVYSTPDAALWTGVPPPRGRGLYMVALQACGRGEGPVQPTSGIHLEDGFGQEFEPRGAATADEFEYDPRRLAPGVCLPAAESPAQKTFGGAPLVFSLPFDSVRERPMILVLGGTRIVLDL